VLSSLACQTFHSAKGVFFLRIAKNRLGTRLSAKYNMAKPDK